MMNRAPTTDALSRAAEPSTTDGAARLGAVPPAGAVAHQPPCGCDSGLRIDLGLSITDLAAVRFAADPVWETVAGLGVLSHPQRHRLHHRLVDRVSNPRYDLGLLLDLMGFDHWFPTFLCPEPNPRPHPPESALTSVAEVDLAVVQRDLDAVRRLAPLNRRWRQMTAEQLADQTSTALLGFWRQALSPLWERLTEIVEADLAVRGRQIAALGLAATLADLHDDLTLLGDHLRVRLPGHHRHQTSRGSGLWFVPTVFRWPRLVVETDSAVPIVGYPARGTGRLWDSCATGSPVGLRQVVGGSRADILARLHTPATTTRLAQDLHRSPGTISTHLTALTRAGLLESSRRGREVFYRRTTLGDTLTSRPGAGASG